MSAYTVAVLADSPVSYWRLDEAAGPTAADQQAANAGTYSGTGVTFSAAGAITGDTDKAVTLDGAAGAITTASSSLLVFAAGFTLEAWVKPTDQAGTYAIISKGTAGAFFWALASGKQEHWFNGAMAVTNSSTAPPAGVWSHVAVVWDQPNTLVRFYLNGQPDGTATPTNTGQPAGNQATGIGATTTPGLWFKGGLDEVAVYGTALSAARILAHYNAGSGPNVSESLTVTDSPVVKGPSQPVVSESVTLTDTPALFGGAQPKPSESVTVSDTPVLKGGAQPVVSEALTVTDTPVVKGPAQPKPSEALTVSESAAVGVVVAAGTSEAVTLTDAATVQGPAQPNVSEALTVTDTPTVQGPSQPVVSEAVTVSETVAALLPYLLVAASQAVTLTETVASQVQVTASVSEQVTVTDSPALKGGAQPQASESLTVTDSPTVKGGAQPQVSESLTVSETTVGQLVSFISASQAVSISDAPAVQISGGAALSITASETLSVTETSAPILPYLVVSTAQALAVSDTPAVRALIRVAAGEQITVSTTVRFPINYFDAQSGTLTFTGSATSSIGPDLNVTWKRQHLYYVDYRNWVRGP